MINKLIKAKLILTDLNVDMYGKVYEKMEDTINTIEAEIEKMKQIGFNDQKRILSSTSDYKGHVTERGLFNKMLRSAGKQISVRQTPMRNWKKRHINQSPTMCATS